MKCLSTLLVLVAIVGSLLNEAQCIALDKAQLDLLVPSASQAATTELNLANKTYDSIATGTFTAFTTLATINLDSNKLAGQSITVLDLTTLKTLILSRNGLKDVTFTTPATDKLKAVTYLDLSGNLIETIPTAYPAYASVVATLNMQNNLLTQLAADQFTAATLLTIDLSGNSIATVAAGAFKATELTTLNLANNQLTAFSGTSVSGSTKIALLDLANNKINTFPSDVFATLRFLRELDLDQNQITKLTGDFLGTSTSLKILRVAGNSISELNLTPLNDPTRCLSYIDLSNNPITNGISIFNDTVRCKRVTCKSTNSQSGVCIYNSSGRLSTGGVWVLLTIVGSYLVKF